LQESFATHYNQLAEQACFGQDHFDWERLKACNSALSVTNKKPLATSNIPIELVYQKGSQVLEMLKYVIGREAFNRGIKRYLTDHKYANVDSEDLLDAFHDELGLTLNWFWDQWIYREGEPAYNVAYSDLIGKDKKRFTEFVVTQTHTINEQIGLFKMPIEFEVHYTDGTSEKVTEWIEKQRHVVRVPNSGNKKIDFVLFDPNNRVLKTVTFERSFEELKAQALRATNMLDRYEALLALKNFPVDKKLGVLEEIYATNTFYALKGEAINQLQQDTSSRALTLIKKGLSDSDIKVRKEIVKNTKKIHPSLEASYSHLLKDSSYELIGNTLDLLAQNFPKNTLSYLEQTKDVEGTIGKNVRIKWLRIAYGQTKDTSYLKQLVAYTSVSYEFATRTNAMKVLRRLNYCNETLVENCMDGILNKNGKLSEVSSDILKHFYILEENKKLIKQKIEAFQGENFYKLMLEKVLI
jgi:aminopeptidase N